MLKATPLNVNREGLLFCLCVWREGDAISSFSKLVSMATASFSFCILSRISRGERMRVRSSCRANRVLMLIWPLCSVAASEALIRPLMPSISSSNSLLSTSTSMLGRVVIFTCTFFMRCAKAVISLFSKMRLHMVSHCSCRSSSLKLAFSSLFFISTSAALFTFSSFSCCLRLAKVIPKPFSLRGLAVLAADVDAVVPTVAVG